MSLTAAQIALMRDPELRKILTTARTNFSSFDSYYASFGSSCPRLVPPFTSVIRLAKDSKAALAYIKTKHPSISIVPPPAIPTTPAVAQVPPPPTMEEARKAAVLGGVSRAIQFLEARKRKDV